MLFTFVLKLNWTLTQARLSMSSYVCILYLVFAHAHFIFLFIHVPLNAITFNTSVLQGNHQWQMFKGYEYAFLNHVEYGTVSTFESRGANDT